MKKLFILCQIFFVITCIFATDFSSSLDELPVLSAESIEEIDYDYIDVIKLTNEEDVTIIVVNGKAYIFQHKK